jgi:hypothetical protein
MLALVGLALMVVEQQHNPFVVAEEDIGPFVVAVVAEEDIGPFVVAVAAAVAVGVFGELQGCEH